MAASQNSGNDALGNLTVSRRTVLKGAAASSFVLLIPGLAACGGSAAKKGGSGSSVSGGIGYNVSTKFDPAISTDVMTTSVNNHLHEALVTIDPPTRKLAPGLATAMPSLTGRTATVTIRDATFHDGTPVTADDVAFSFMRIKDTALNSPYSGYLDFITDVKAKDAKTVEFTLAYPSSLFAGRLALVQIVPKKVLGSSAAGFETKPIGCGPYRFKDFQQNDHVSVTAFDGYTGTRKDGPKDVTFRIQVDGSSRVAAMSAKQVDMIDDVPYQDVANLTKVSNVKTAMEQAVMQTILMFHCGKKPFDDKRVRQALHYAIDKEAIARDVFLGNCEIATSPLSKTHPDYVRPSTIYTYNPEKAKGLLAAAGYPDGLKVTLKVNSQAWVGPQGAIIQSSAAKAGFKITLDTGQTAALFKDVTAGNFEAFITPTDPSIFGYDADTLLRYINTGKVAEQWLRWSGAGKTKVGQLMDDAAKLTDQAQQKQLWGQVQDIVADEAAGMSVHYKKEATAWREDVMSWYRPLPYPGLYVAGEHAG